MYTGKFVEKISKRKSRYEDDEQPMRLKEFKTKNKRPKHVEENYEYQRSYPKTNRRT
jgi:hypothetical protein